MVTLTVDDVSFAYPDGPPVLADLSLELAAGALTCVLGPNGAGKTTLLKLCAGLLSPNRGAVRLDGRPVGGLAPRERARQLAVVPQTLEAIPDVTVTDFVFGGRYGHLDAWRRVHAKDRRAVELSLAAADVEPFADRLMTELSGGQRQRVLVARALAQEPSVFLVDEPTSSLDPEHQLAIFELIAGLTGHGRTVVCVTHDLNLASQFATRLVVMKDGRLVKDGRPSEVLRPEVLDDVYGTDLHYGALATPDGGERPFVVPRRTS